MTEIKTAQAWGTIQQPSGYLWRVAVSGEDDISDVPVLIVHGITESELRELVARRGVCEWEYRFKGTIESGHRTACGVTVTVVESARLDASFCPSCGRKVKVVE